MRARDRIVLTDRHSMEGYGQLSPVTQSSRLIVAFTWLITEGQAMVRGAPSGSAGGSPPSSPPGRLASLGLIVSAKVLWGAFR